MQRLSRAAAVMALFTLQSYAPAGGRGNLTSLRGGSPLTTLVIPGSDAPGRPLPLWHLLWANVPRGRRPPADALPRVFPWLAPTRTADRFRATIPDQDADRLQAFCSMPRRIRLDFAPNPERLPCDLTGPVDDVIVTGWRQRPNGVRYAHWDHPLSPMYRDGKGGGWLPVHPQPGGIGYRHWVGLAIDSGAGSNTRKRAACIATWHDERRRRIDRSAGDGARLLAAGYDMDNMKARAFAESEMPLPGSHDAVAERVIARRPETLVKAARALRLSIRDACYDADTAIDAGPMAAAYEAFWSATHDGFLVRLREAADLALAEPDEAREIDTARSWCDLLRRATLDLFDQAAPLDPGAASFDPARIVRARARLFWMFMGRNAAGKRLFEALGLPDPEPAKPKPRRRTMSKESA